MGKDKKTVIRGRIVLVLGGVSSGKSEYAEELLKAEYETAAAAGRTGRFYYFTPAGQPEDDEMMEKVRLHQERRPDWLKTVECGIVVREQLSELQPGSIVLFDSVGTLLGNMIMSAMDNILESAQEIIRESVQIVMDHGIEIIIVSEETGLSPVPATESGRKFQRTIGTLNQIVAAAADEVYFITAGLPLQLK
jgi:adenosylcobinamide kinase/adenosylcobinamide-phosphate guanylyltransferase